MRIKPLNALVQKQLKRYRLERMFLKQQALFEANPAHPGLNTEKLEPKSVGLYSFRIDLKYRAIFRIRGGLAEIVHVTKHYER